MHERSRLLRLTDAPGRKRIRDAARGDVLSERYKTSGRNRDCRTEPHHLRPAFSIGPSGSHALLLVTARGVMSASKSGTSIATTSRPYRPRSDSSPKITVPFQFLSLSGALTRGRALEEILAPSPVAEEDAEL